MLPGALIITFYLISAPYLINLGFPSGLALLLGFLFVGIPFELGYLLYQGKKRNGTVSLRGVVLYREPMPIWQYVLFFLLLFVFAFAVLILISPVTNFLAVRQFSWLPVYLLPDSESLYPEGSSNSRFGGADIGTGG